MKDQFVIAVDLQDGFLNEEIRRTDYVARVIKFLQRVDPSLLVLTKFVNKPGSNFENLINWPKMQSGDSQVRLFGELERRGHPVVTKSVYTSWVPEVADIAKKIHSKEVIIFGLDTEACVLKTALDVFDAGLQPIVLSDLCASSGGVEYHELGLKLLTKLIGVSQVFPSTNLEDN